jgi:uncharacterized protein (DUF2249 family)
MPTWERHARIYAAFDSLEAGASLLVITDHEPRPLRLQLEQLRPQQFIWAQRHLGIGRWDIALRRISTSAGEVDDAVLTFLRYCAVLSEAREETYRAFAQVATQRTFDVGITIVEQDVQWPYLGFVRTGTLGAIMGSTTGREQRLFDVMTCETFGDIETLDGGRTVAHLRSTAGDREGRGGNPPIRPPDAGLSPALEPLQRMTQAELAVTAGTVKEVAARAVAELECVGAIQRVKGHIALVDRQRLQAVLDDK